MSNLARQRRGLEGRERRERGRALIPPLAVSLERAYCSYDLVIYDYVLFCFRS